MEWIERRSWSREEMLKLVTMQINQALRNIGKLGCRPAIIIERDGFLHRLAV